MIEPPPESRQLMGRYDPRGGLLFIKCELPVKKATEKLQAEMVHGWWQFKGARTLLGSVKGLAVKLRVNRPLVPLWGRPFFQGALRETKEETRTEPILGTVLEGSFVLGRWDFYMLALPIAVVVAVSVLAFILLTLGRENSLVVLAIFVGALVVGGIYSWGLFFLGRNDVKWMKARLEEILGGHAESRL
jgi:hypothetical protein